MNDSLQVKREPQVMDHDSIGGKSVSLERALTTLANSDVLRQRLKAQFGDEVELQMYAMMKAGALSGDLGNLLHDYLTDAASNDQAELVWMGSHSKPYNDADETWPIQILHFCGIYWAWTPEYDLVGYFLNLEDAKLFCLSWFDGVTED